jgi:hypothetical protein
MGCSAMKRRGGGGGGGGRVGGLACLMVKRALHKRCAQAAPLVSVLEVVAPGVPRWFSGCGLVVSGTSQPPAAATRHAAQGW